MEGLKILFLHELESAPGSEKQKLLENAVGKQRVKAPNLKTRQTIMVFVLLYVLLAVLCATAVIVTAFVAKWYVALGVLLGLLLLLGLTYWLGGRGVTHYIVVQAVKLAEKKFKEQRPNVIVATSFGSVIALSMDCPHVPLLLFAPAQDQYKRFLRLSSGWSIAGYPYVMIVHGSRDKSIPLDESIRLVETSEVGKCRLEVVDDTHALKSVTVDDIRAWVEEVYTRGTQFALKMAQEGDKQIDPSLFDADSISTTSGTGDAPASVTV